MSNATAVSAKRAEMHDAAAAVSPWIVAIVKMVETALLQLVTDPTAKVILQKIIDWINTLLTSDKTEQGRKLVQLNEAVDNVSAPNRPIIQAIITALVNLLGGLSGNPAVLNAIIALIMQLLGGLPTPTPVPPTP